MKVFKKIIKIILIALGGILAIILVLFGLLLLLFWSMKEGKKMSDPDMISYFYAHSGEFTTLNTKLLALEAKGLKRIDDDRTDPEDVSKVGLSTGDLKSLRDELFALNIPRGIVGFEGSITYLSYTYGLSISGWEKGFYYAKTPPSNFYDFQSGFQMEPYTTYKDKKFPLTGSYSVYVKISDDRYIFENERD